MNENIFDKTIVAVLLSPWKWKIVSTLFPPDHSSVTNQRHQLWSTQHRDRHPSREVLISLKGNCLYSFKQKLYPCDPGTVFLFDAFEEHDNYYAPDTDDVYHLWLSLVQNDVFFNLHYVRNGRIISSGRSFTARLHSPDMENVLRSCWTELSAPGPLPDSVRRMKIIAALMNVVIRIMEWDPDKDSRADGHGSREDLIKSIQKHIRETSGKGLTIDNLARIAGYSKFHFLRLFHHHAGKSVHEYVDECRLKTAREMQAQGSLKKQIAEALGFSCLAAYSRWYKTARYTKGQG